MMVSLALAAASLLLLTAVFIFWPRRDVSGSQQTPVQQFEERLKLLAAARDSGELAEADFVTAAHELKSQFQLQQQQSLYADAAYSWRMPSVILLVVLTIVAGIYAYTGHYRQLQHWQDAQDNLKSYGERALLNQGEPLSAAEIESFALALRTKLAKEGDDAIAWMLLGRIRMSQGGIEEAVAAFEHALKLTPERSALLLSYAQALIILGDENSLVRAGRAVARVMVKEPENIDALSLMALIAYEKGDINEATTAWQLMLQRLPKSDARYEAIKQRLSELGADVNSGGRQIKVKLYVAPQLKSANPDASLFLFARAINGAPLPLAVQRIPLPAGDIELMLTEQMAMQTAWSLANADQIEVIARMSQSGTVEQRPGDIQTVSEILEFTEPVISISLRLEP